MSYTVACLFHLLLFCWSEKTKRQQKTTQQPPATHQHTWALHLHAPYETGCANKLFRTPAIPTLDHGQALEREVAETLHMSQQQPPERRSQPSAGNTGTYTGCNHQPRTGHHRHIGCLDPWHSGHQAHRIGHYSRNIGEQPHLGWPTRLIWDATTHRRGLQHPTRHNIWAMLPTGPHA